MRLMIGLIALASVSFLSSGASGEEISVERGKLISIIGGCHDCHTEGYSESEGTIDLAKAFKGSSVGWRGPWGTTYAQNLRLRVNDLSEDGFVTYLKSLRVLPPMPWYNVRAMPESDIRSLYRYAKSLGEPGSPTDNFVPAFVPFGEEPPTNFIVLAPPQTPQPCARDLDCGVGEVCSPAPSRACVPQ